MGYQGVKTPRFYIDYLQYFFATGRITPPSSDSIFGLGGIHSYSSIKQGTTEYSDVEWELPTPNEDYGSINFLAVLNHNIATAKQDYSVIDAYFNDYNIGWNNFTTGQGFLEKANSYYQIDGYSIQTHTELALTDGLNVKFAVWLAGNLPIKIGSVVLGKYYDMPHSPDLSLSMSHEYSGISKTQSASGSTYTNANWSKPPKWGELDAWELNFDSPGYNPRYHMSGRRSWDLSFSYISDTDLEPRNYTGWDTSGNIGDDNWFQNVLYYTMGGHLPFIFCPDPSIEYYNDGTNPPRVPEFAICRFDMNTFERTQVAHNVYNMKVKIVETW